nr:AAA family ATPase [Oscillatoria sp. FACHB-1406]
MWKDARLASHFLTIYQQLKGLIPAETMNRISIVGTTGSGKTTLARAIADRLQIPHVELDALQWEPNWVAASDEVFRDRIAHSLQGNRWVVDGNYSRVQDLVWGKADTVIWLDYPLPTIMRQLFKRTVYRSLTNQELWNGNRETWRMSFFSRDSILLWALRTYRKRRRTYPLLFQKSEYKHLQIIHLRSPAQTQNWLQRLSS